MITLRTTLEPSLSGMLTDPGGVFWPARVEDFRNTFLGSGFVPLDSPRVTTLPNRAVVYFGAGDNVTARNLDNFRLFWSDRVWSVAVSDVRIVGGVDSVADDIGKMQEGGVGGLLSDLGATARGAITIVAVGGAVALMLYALGKSGGVKSWR